MSWHGQRFRFVGNRDDIKLEYPLENGIRAKREAQSKGYTVKNGLMLKAGRYGVYLVDGDKIVGRYSTWTDLITAVRKMDHSGKLVL